MGHDVFGQVALQVVGTPAHFAQGTARVRVAAQQDDHQLQRGGPTTGEFVDLMEFFRAELQGRQALFEKGAGFGQIERQSGAIEFQQLPAQA
ncbi:hypothetical protein D9M71_800970 [compost metagenome]